jgi:DAD family
MAKKPAAQSPAAKAPPVGASKPPPPAVRHSSSLSTSTTPSKSSAASNLSPRSSPQEIVLHVWNIYLQDTPSRTILLDVFLAFIALNGAVQFVYCILAGNYVCRPRSLPLHTADSFFSHLMPSFPASVPALDNSFSPSPYECRLLSDRLQGHRLLQRRPRPRPSMA